MSALRQTWQVSLRGLRALIRQPAYLGITLTQPIIWLLLFGALFKAVTRIPGFHGGSYVDFLTPGIVVMLAVSSAGWTATSQPTTSAPSLANVMAVARPMPPPLPVTMQTLPSNLPAI